MLFCDIVHDVTQLLLRSKMIGVVHLGALKSGDLICTIVGVYSQQKVNFSHQDGERATETYFNFKNPWFRMVFTINHVYDALGFLML